MIMQESAPLQGGLMAPDMCYDVYTCSGICSPFGVSLCSVLLCSVNKSVEDLASGM